MTLLHLHLHQRLAQMAVRGEQCFNCVLVSVTGVHEWGTLIGYTCVPLTLFLVVHLVCDLCERESR